MPCAMLTQARDHVYACVCMRTLCLCPCPYLCPCLCVHSVRPRVMSGSLFVRACVRVSVSLSLPLTCIDPSKCTHPNASIALKCHHLATRQRSRAQPRAQKVESSGWSFLSFSRVNSTWNTPEGSQGEVATNLKYWQESSGAYTQCL